MIKILNIHAPTPAIFLVAVDMVIFYVCIATGLYLSYAPDYVFYNLSFENFIVEKSLFVSVLFLSFFAVGAYNRRFLTDMKLGFLALAIAHLLAFGLLTVAFYVLPDYRIWISALGPALGLNFIAVLASHVAFDRLVGVKLFQKKVVVFGAGRLAERLYATIERSPYLVCVACISPAGQRAVPAIDSYAQPPSLVEFAKMVGADEVVVAVADRRHQTPTMELLDCRTRGIQVSDLVSFVERVDGRVEIENLQPSWLIYSNGFAGASPIQKNLKRLIDIGLSAALLVLSAPIIIVAGLAVVLDSAGPALYSQTRVGAEGRCFRLWKLRSMRVDAEGDGVARWAATRDHRITRVGAVIRRLRIDELPQLYNVLIGDMSFVGPRPERPEFVDQLAHEVSFYNYRHTMKPGITGWAQIHYPYGNSFEDAIEKLKYDLYYIKNGSLALDFIVFLQTLRVIIWPNSGAGEKPRAAAQLDLPAPPARFLDGTS